MKHRENNCKKPNCNNFDDHGPRESVIKRAEFQLRLFPRNEPEVWVHLTINPNYEISSWGRVKHLKSYGGKSRILLCTLKSNKHPSFSISNNGKRIGLSLLKCYSETFELVLHSS